MSKIMARFNIYNHQLQSNDDDSDEKDDQSGTSGGFQFDLGTMVTAAPVGGTDDDEEEDRIASDYQFARQTTEDEDEEGFTFDMTPITPTVKEETRVEVDLPVEEPIDAEFSDASFWRQTDYTEDDLAAALAD